MSPKPVPLPTLNIRKQNIILHILIPKSIPDPGIRFKKEYQDSRLKGYKQRVIYVAKTKLLIQDVCVVKFNKSTIKI